MNLYTRAIWLRRFLPRKTLAGIVAGLIASCLILAGSGTWAQEIPMPMPQSGPNYIDALKKPPDPQRVFRLESADVLQQRMAREAKLKLNPLNLEYNYVSPAYPQVPKPEPVVVRQWEPLTETVEPGCVCHNRLYFQQINAERYGWSFGVLHPLISLGDFYVDMATLPYHAAQQPFQKYECSAGYCLPGDRTPLMLYMPEPSLTGSLAEAAGIGLLFLAFP